MDTSSGNSLGCWIVVALLVTCGCGADDSEGDITPAVQPIVFGDPVSGHTAAVAVYHSYVRPCSGVYLGNRWVMTARHCVDDSPMEEMLVTSELSPGPSVPASWAPPKWRRVQRIELYPGAMELPVDASYAPDLALLKLDGDLEAHQGGPIIRVSGRINATSDVNGKTLLCQGYGLFYDGLSENATVTSGVQRQGWFSAVRDPQLDPDNLFRTYDTNDFGFQHGDSGGPCFVVVQFRGGGAIILAGISEINKGPYARQWSVARDTPYSAWIDQTIAN